MGVGLSEIVFPQIGVGVEVNETETRVARLISSNTGRVTR